MLRKISSILFFISLLTLFCFQITQAAVDLADFTATPLSDSILIKWETATEIDNAGFYVTRSTNEAGPYNAISDFISAEGSGSFGAEYEYTDGNVSVGVLYYYKLEMIDNSQLSEWSDWITAIIENPDSTPTPTSTPTSTNTNTPSSPPSSTATRTPIPTRTFTPAPPTLTPTPYTHTPTITLSPTITPTATLENPPALILTLPATHTPLPSATVNMIPSITPTSEPVGFFDRFVDSGYPLTMGAICLVALVWAAIAVGIFILFQHRNS